jgi:hypothetical protein
MLIDGWETPWGVHIYAFLLRTTERIHFLGLRWTAESDQKQHGLWLAQQLKAAIESVHLTRKIQVVAICADNASVISAALQILNGLTSGVRADKAKYYGVEENVIEQARLGFKICRLRCCCHTLDLCVHKYIEHFHLKDSLYGYSPTRWISALHALFEL